jgi:beta-lactamase regulating signal transducer with metallopeptidase domain
MPLIPEWILRASGQAALAAIVLIALRWMLGSRLSPRLSYCMWALIALRLILPVVPQSSLSLFNFFSHTPDVTTPLETVIEFGAPAFNSGAVAFKAAALSKIDESWSWQQWAGLGWLCGVLFMVGRVLVQYVALSRMLRRASAVRDSRLLRLLEDCRAELAVRSQVGLIESAEFSSPFLAGVRRPVICLPQNISNVLDDSELRFVFLHELAHVKRRDIAVNWALFAVQALHWFNPLVWLAFACCRADRELLCDQWVLSRTRKSDHGLYGHTLLKLLQNRAALPADAVAVLGVYSSRRELIRRIHMIADTRRPSMWTTLLAALTVLLTTCIAMTEAEETPAPPVSSASTKDRSLSIYEFTDLIVNQFVSGWDGTTTPASNETAVLDELKKLIKRAERGAEIEFKGHKLVLTAGPKTHETVSAHLARLRKTTLTMVCVESRIIEFENSELKNIAKALKDKTQAAALLENPDDFVGGITSEQSEVIFKRLNKGDGKIISSPRIVMFNNQNAMMSVGSQAKAYIADYDIKVGEDGKRRFEPVIKTGSQLGLAMDLRASVSEDQKSIALKFKLTHSYELRPPQIVFIKGEGDAQLPIELPSQEMRSKEFTFQMPNGGMMLARAFGKSATDKQERSTWLLISSRVIDSVEEERKRF